MAAAQERRQVVRMTYSARTFATFRLVALLAASACSAASDRAAATVDSTHAAISDSAKGPGIRDGVWSGAEGHSSWHAVLEGPQVRQLDEVALFTDSTRAMRQFRFDSLGGWLLSAREERSQKVYGAHATPDTVNTIIEIEWHADSLVRSSKRVNSADKLLQPYEVNNLREHARELLRIARAGTAPAPATR